MDDFVKYNSIENSYQKKFLARFKDVFDFSNELFVVSEKIDGANIQFLFRPNEKFSVGKRTAWLEEGEEFYGIWNVLEGFSEQIAVLQKEADSKNKEIRVYAELYGKGVQNRVDYGKEKKICFFDVVINGKYLTKFERNNFLHELGLDFLLPKKLFEGSLEDCLDFDVEGKNIEGVIVEPYNNIFILGYDRLIIKKKSENFNDRPVRRPKKEKVECPLNLKFREYINENRVKDVFSKYGEINNTSQMTDYIKYVLDDAISDFCKDTDFEKKHADLSKDERKRVFNVGGDIVGILKKFL